MQGELALNPSQRGGALQEVGCSEQKKKKMEGSTGNQVAK